MNAFYQALLDALFLAVLLLSLGTLIAGVMMLLAPQRFVRAGQVSNRWVSLDRWLAPLDIPRYIDRIFYRFHPILGAFLVAGATYALIYFTVGYDGARMADLILGVGHGAFAKAMLDSAVILIGVGSGFALVVGLILIIRPSLLKGFEVWSNRWVASDQAIRRLEKSYSMTDTAFSRRHRVFGLLVIVGSLYIVFNMWGLVF